MRIFNSKMSSRGFTLIELMVGMLVGILISAAAVSAFLAHTRTVYQQMSTNQANEDLNSVFAILSRVIMQSHRDTIVVTPTVVSEVLTAATIDVELIADTCIWPNLTGSCDQEWVRLAWSSTGDNANQILVSTATELAGLPDATKTVLAGGSTGNNTRYTAMNLLTDGGDPATFLFSMSAKSFQKDVIDGTDADIGSTIEARILPRN